MMNKKIKNNKGYTLLFAVLVSSVVLSVGISILTISKKEYLLSSSARESVIAFYAADSGLECALYNNDNDNFPIIGSPTFNISCMGNPSVIVNRTDSENTHSFSFETNMQDNTNACARVSIVKIFDSGGIFSTTTIESRGYNLGWSVGGTCNISSPRKVERAIEFVF